MRVNRLFYYASLMLLFQFAHAEEVDLPGTIVIGNFCERKSDGTYKTSSGKVFTCKNQRRVKDQPDALIAVDLDAPRTGANDNVTGTGTGSGSSISQGCGYMANGNWVEIPCDNPKIEMPFPTSLTPDKLDALKTELNHLKNTYVRIFEDLKKKAESAEKTLIYDIGYCERVHTIGTYKWQENRQQCKDKARERFEKAIEKIKSDIATAKDDFNEAIANILAAAGLKTGVGIPELDVPNPEDIASGGNSGTGNTTNNTTVVNNTSTTVVNNTTNVSGGSGGGNGSTSNGTTQGKEQGNFIEEFCKSNSNAFLCAKVDDKGIADATKTDGESLGDGTEESALNGLGQKLNDLREGKTVSAFKAYVYKQFVGGHTASCPAPLNLTSDLMGFNVVMSYDYFCRFLLLVRPFVIGCFALMTMFFVVISLR